MSEKKENQEKHGKREVAGGRSSLKTWWAQHRAWVKGLDKKHRLRYRLFQGLVVFSVLVLALFLWLRAWIRLPDVPDPPQPIQPGPGSSSSSQTGPALEYEGAELPEVIRSGRKEGYYTFLVAGQDEISGATDTMILFTYDTKGQKVNAISLLRDTMINTKAGSKRLNTVYARNRGGRDLPDKERVEKGMTALKQEVSKLTGIYPDFYVLVEWEAIGELVDAIGGVEFEVPFLMNYKDPYQDLVIYQEPGLRTLDGRDAMEVIRFRKNSDGSHQLGDAGRTQIQRDFLTAVLKECLKPEILLKLPTLAQIFMDNVDTDLTIGNILAFAQLAVGMDTEKDVKFVSMPYDNAWYGGAAMAVARQDELLELLNDGLDPYLDEIKASDLQLIYRKSGGGYDVTNGVLADPAMGRVPPPAPPKEEEPTDSDKDSGSVPSGEAGDTSQPSGTQSPGTGDTSQPSGTQSPGTGDTSQPSGTQPPEGTGDTPQTGGTEQPGDIGDIDPAKIFPDPSPDIQNDTGGTPGQDPLQAAA